MNYRDVLDLGNMPLANTLPRTANTSQPRYPLSAVVCRDCRLVQLTHAVPPAVIFDDYPYFSSCSSSWVEHARQFCTAATARLGLGTSSLVVEVASNDGYLLRHFLDLGVPVLGVEPAETVAAAARSIGVPTECVFFGSQTAVTLAARGCAADLIVANNVLAHVPELNDFVSGLALLLKPGGWLCCEFPHLLRLMQGMQFDTIYHEHFSYFSLLALEKVLERHGLIAVDVEELPTHGGSLRLWITASSEGRAASERLLAVRKAELVAGLDKDDAYDRFAAAVRRCMDGLRQFLEQARANRWRVAGYGAAAKSATLLGACGITSADIVFVADINPQKQGRFIPGTGIPIVSPEDLIADKPDIILILPWNLQGEITTQLACIHEWGGRFAVAIPEVRIFP